MLGSWKSRIEVIEDDLLVFGVVVCRYSAEVTKTITFKLDKYPSRDRKIETLMFLIAYVCSLTH